MSCGRPYTSPRPAKLKTLQNILQETEEEKRAVLLDLVPWKKSKKPELQELQAMRVREGAALATDLRQRLESLRGLAAQIAQTAAGLDRYSQYSYAGVGLALVGGLMLTFYKSSVPR